MVANRAYKFRIYPNDEQKILFAKTFGCVRMVYNHSVGHTGIARICLAYSVIKREPNLPTPLQVERMSQRDSNIDINRKERLFAARKENETIRK